MKRFGFGLRSLLPLVLGVLLGGLGAFYYLFPDGLTFEDWKLLAERGASIREPMVEEEETWPPREFSAESDWCYWKVDDQGWTTGWVGTFEELGKHLDRLDGTTDEVVIPVLPTVYKPQLGDKLYYDFLLESDIAPGDKVLVIGCGSGADSWMVARKTESLVYAADINPMAVVNAKATARIAGFAIEAVAGDIRTVELPDDFRDFDYVLWNMPFVETFSSMENLENRGFHDGDDGTILTAFLDRLPTLLKEDGKAILLNFAAAEQFIKSPGVTTLTSPEVKEVTPSTYMLFVVPNPATATEETEASEDDSPGQPSPAANDDDA